MPLEGYKPVLVAIQSEASSPCDERDEWGMSGVVSGRRRGGVGWRVGEEGDELEKRGMSGRGGCVEAERDVWEERGGVE